MRGKYEKFSLAELKENVLTLIKDTLKEITTEKNQTNIPLFVGKNIEHLFSDGVKYCGHVISVVPGFPKWYNVQYQNDEAIYAYNLCTDYEKGEVNILI